jgi:hypothetical protein
MVKISEVAQIQSLPHKTSHQHQSTTNHDVCRVQTRKALALAALSAMAHGALRSFYEQHAPHLVPKVPSVLKSFRDRLPDLERRLQLKYGMAPTLQPADLPTARSETSILLLTETPPSSLLSLLSYWDALLVRRSCLRLRRLIFEAEPDLYSFWQGQPQQRAADMQTKLIEQSEAGLNDRQVERRTAALGRRSGLLPLLQSEADLVDAQYLIGLAEAGAVLPDWQTFPSNARISAGNMWRLGSWTKACLPVVVVSAPWLDVAHPDPKGDILGCILPILRVLVAEAKKGHECGKWTHK